MFEHRSDWVSVKQVANSADVSPATASETLTELERRDWVKTRGKGPAKQRRLTRADEILDVWTQDVATKPAPRYRRYFVPKADAHGIVDFLSAVARQTGARYAITGEATAQAYAPYLSNITRVHCRMVPDMRSADLLDRMEARPVAKGWNIAVLETRDLSDFADTRTIGEATYASPCRSILTSSMGPGEPGRWPTIPAERHWDSNVEATISE